MEWQQQSKKAGATLAMAVMEWTLMSKKVLNEVIKLWPNISVASELWITSSKPVVGTNQKQQHENEKV